MMFLKKVSDEYIYRHFFIFAMKTGFPKKIANIFWKYSPEYIKFIEGVVRRGPEPLRHGVYALDVLNGLAVDGEGAFSIEFQFEYSPGQNEAQDWL